MSVTGDNIRALRTLFGNGRDLTQVELAEIIGVTRETVNKWEAGSIGNVRTSNINRLREYFNLSVDDLRSETNGLAAQLRALQESEIKEHLSARISEEMYSVPFVSLNDLRGAPDSIVALRQIEVPPSLVQNHRSLYAFEMTDCTMARILPKGFHVIVDLDTEPQAGTIVVLDVPEISADLIVRYLELDQTKAVLSAKMCGGTDKAEIELSNANVIGTVVWCQPPHELDQNYPL